MNRPALGALCLILVMATVAAAQEPLSVMSFNIRYGTASDGDNRWERRRDLVIATIRRHDPDVIGLQEALRFQIDEIRAALPQYGEAGVGRDDGREAGEYAAILFRTNRMTLDMSDTFWFSGTPTVPGSMSWGNRVTRICTWARFTDTRPGGASFFVYNVHFDHESQPSRERSAALLLRRIAARRDKLPVILTGDFNAGEANPVMQRLRDALIDTYRQVRPFDTVVGTFNGFRGDSLGERIDAIFVSDDWQVLDAAIVRDHVDGQFPSDHFPVMATVSRGRRP